MADFDNANNLTDDILFDDIRYCNLGKRIIHVTTLFETAISNFISAEGEAIDAITYALPPEGKSSIPDLLTFNETTRDIMCCLSEIKEEVIEELDLGNEIAKTGAGPCL